MGVKPLVPWDHTIYWKIHKKTNSTINHLCFKLSHLDSNILQVFGVLLSSLRELRLELFVLMLPLLQLCALVEELSLQGIDVSRQAGLGALCARELLLQ